MSLTPLLKEQHKNSPSGDEGPAPTGYYCNLCKVQIGFETAALAHLSCSRRNDALWNYLYNPHGSLEQDGKVRVPSFLFLAAMLLWVLEGVTILSFRQIAIGQMLFPQSNPLHYLLPSCRGQKTYRRLYPSFALGEFLCVPCRQTIFLSLFDHFQEPLSGRSHVQQMTDGGRLPATACVRASCS